MTMLARMSWLELKLFLREPLTVLFALVLPMLVLFVMGGVFGNDADPEFYRGIGAMDYYVPAYVALVTASVGLISLPAHIAGNRERGVLKRYHASGVPAWVVVGSEVVVTFVIAAVSAAVLVTLAVPIYGIAAPDSWLLVLAGFALSALVFASLGVLLGAVIPSSRAAQALGVMLWFVMLMLGGAGPPPEVLTGFIGTVGEVTPLRYTVRVMQDGWLALDAGLSWLIAGGIMFVSAVLGFTEDTWSELFQRAGLTYERPKLVLYNGSTPTACGFGSAASGPFYCPGDLKVYIDLDFFSELHRLGASGDFAQAYVISHEVAHHVQNLLGTMNKVDRVRRNSSKADANALSVRLELQADCYAGVWAHHAQKEFDILERGDIEEGLDAASAVGDDRLQRMSGRGVHPESFTHGTSRQRADWFRNGLKNGSVEACNTFG